VARTRTNIEIEETYLRTIMDRYGIHTKTEAVTSRCATWQASR
jgi:Arc/MetJ family transcription regulator